MMTEIRMKQQQQNLLNKHTTKKCILYFHIIIKIEVVDKLPLMIKDRIRSE